MTDNDTEEQKKNDMDDNKAKDCAVCKDKFKRKELLIELPCHHRFHKDCILPWLNIRNSCPTCRHRLPTDNQFYEQIQNAQNDNNGPQSPFNILSNLFGAQQQSQNNNGNNNNSNNEQQQ